LNTRRADGGFLNNLEAGRIGRGAKLPPQFGHTPSSLFSAQSRQNVHSKVQIIASVAAGGKSLSQHSQLGRSSSMNRLLSGAIISALAIESDFGDRQGLPIYGGPLPPLRALRTCTVPIGASAKWISPVIDFQVGVSIRLPPSVFSVTENESKGRTM
jgi:hypothetical protein